MSDTCRATVHYLSLKNDAAVQVSDVSRLMVLQLASLGNAWRPHWTAINKAQLHHTHYPVKAVKKRRASLLFVLAPSDHLDALSVSLCVLVRKWFVACAKITWISWSLKSTPQ